MNPIHKDVPTKKNKGTFNLFITNSYTITPATRISIRIQAGIDPCTNRPRYSHLMGHIMSMKDGVIHFRRDSAANGSHGEEDYILKKEEILALKVIPKRKTFSYKSSS